MKLFLDTADIREIEKWEFLIDGVTTNPTILRKCGGNIKDIANRIPLIPLSIEVTTNDLDEMMVQARGLSEISRNIVVKIPQETQDGIPCYEIIKCLESGGIRVNATVAMSFGQVILSAKSNATYISIFAGRIGDEGGFPNAIISQSAEWLTRWNYKSQIIVGSIRQVSDVLQAAGAGAHIITVPPEILTKMADHKYTRETVRQFINDSK